MFEQKSITEILSSSSFTFSAEIFPPRNGRTPSLILEKLEALSQLPMDFISVTRGAMGSMRGGTVPIGYMIPDRFGMNALVHFRCRDMNRREVENLLVDHMYFGTRNILAVLGDPLPGEPAAELDPASHNRYACELVRQIAHMNRGRYLPLEQNGEARRGVETEFCIGVACYPEAQDMETELFIMGEKAGAGANFAITQMIFDASGYSDYVGELRAGGIDIPVIPGIRPVTCTEHVRAAENNFCARVPDDLKSRLGNACADESRRICLDFTVELIRKLRRAGAPGVHMFTLNDVDMIKEIMGAL